MSWSRTQCSDASETQIRKHSTSGKALYHRITALTTHSLILNYILVKIGILRGSCLSALALLNLLNELRKRDNMRGLPSIFSLFRNEFNKFNNTRARTLDFIDHMTSEISFLP